MHMSGVDGVIVYISTAMLGSGTHDFSYTSIRQRVTNAVAGVIRHIN